MLTQPATKEPEIVTSIRLSRDEHTFITQYAASQHRSVSGQIRFMVAQLREAEGAEAAA